MIKPKTSLRLFALFCSAFEFALALRLSNLNDPTRVLSFLLLPIHKLSFDPSLAFLAAGALPLSALLYRFGRQPEKPRLGGGWGVPTGGQINSKLVTGAALFGVGWGMAGVCRAFHAHFIHSVNVLTSRRAYSRTRARQRWSCPCWRYWSYADCGLAWCSCTRWSAGMSHSSFHFTYSTPE